MNILSIAEHVGTQKRQLEILKADPNINPDSLGRAGCVIGGIEQSLTELITEQWVPVKISDLNGLIAATTENIRQTKNSIAEVIETVDIQSADQSLRVELAFASLAALEHMLTVLIAALAEKQKPEQTVN